MSEKNEIQIIFGIETSCQKILNIYKLGHGQVNGTLFSLAFLSHSSHGSTLHCCPLQKQTGIKSPFSYSLTPIAKPPKHCSIQFLSISSISHFWAETLPFPSPTSSPSSIPLPPPPNSEP